MFGGIAASLLAAIFLWQATAPYEGGPKTRYETAMGELKTVELPDGTKVTLAGRSTLDVYFSDETRSVELVDGQAYFDVTSNKSHAFVVQIGKTKVRVVGTEFDIQKGEDDVRVSVVKGLVEVAENESIAPSKRLKAGEQIFASLDGNLGKIQTFQQETDISWKLGRLEYINTPLTRVIDEVNRYRIDKIILKDRSLADYPITISLALDQTDRLLTGLEHSGVANIFHRYNRVIIEAKDTSEKPVSK
ncbi:MAG: FecR domain-containing protein [Emcibacter sp.]|nr:FecR domain-containing protein [Emcibacter sp.]